MVECLLRRLLSDFDVEILERTPVEYRCDCSREKLEGVLVSLGPDELRDIIEEDGQAEIVCRFCNTKYQFGKDVLTELLHAAEIGGSIIEK